MQRKCQEEKLHHKTGLFQSKTTLAQTLLWWLPQAEEFKGT